jgi:hypothetical protein
MNAVVSTLSFEVLRFAAAPVSAEVALLELEGRFRASTRRRLGVPRLVAERQDGAHELPPAAAEEARAEPDGALWRASYAVALELLEDETFSLAVGRELLVELPSPNLLDSAGERDVRLAREANALRRTADEARGAAAGALASADDERRARDAAETAAAEAQLARDDLARRVASLEEEVAQARRDHAAELARRDEERQAALSAREQEANGAAAERVAAIEAEAAETRRALKAARADVEAARRDFERERERAQAAEAAVPRGRVTELDGEPVAEQQTTRSAPKRAEAPAAGPQDLPGFLGAGVADPGESVRVLGPRRQRPVAVALPAAPAPGTAAIGARHIEPGQTPQHRVTPAWLARALALAALAVAVIALLIVLKGL